MFKKVKEPAAKYIDLKYFVSKIAILFFSGMISLAPVCFVGMDEVLNESSNIVNEISEASSEQESEKIDELEKLWHFIKENEDVVYVLVGLSTIVLADVLGSDKKDNNMKYICGLFHILTILFGSLLYAQYKTHEVAPEVVESLNIKCFWAVIGLSVVSYINLAIVEKGKKDG